MTITFANIKHIFELLTTTEWINKNNPLTKIEKFKSELQTIIDPKKRAAKEQAIRNMESSIDPAKPFKITLENTRISKNEAEILLSNLHLLYDEQSNFKVESQNAIITLLQDNFNILSSNEVRNVVKAQVFHSYQASDVNGLSNQELYSQILPYCKIIADLFTAQPGLNPYEIAKKLSGYFANFNAAENYLKTVNYATRETLLLSFQYELPSIKSPKILAFFQKLNSFAPTVGRDVLKLFSCTESINSNEKILSIINNQQNQQMLDSKTDIPNIKKLIQEVKSEVIRAVYIYDTKLLSTRIVPYVEKLAELAMQTQLDPEAFREAVQFMKVNGLKRTDGMPEINFEFTVGNKKYFFKKLFPLDVRGFILGKYTNSCQSVGEVGEKTVFDGMNKAHAGFYIITDQEGKIRAQSYAWLAGNRDKSDIILDSFEYLGVEDEKLFKPAMNILRSNLSNYNLSNLYVGIGGQTPKISFATKPRPEPIESDLYKYKDSENVYHINEDIPIIPIPEIQITAPQLKFSNFEELKIANRIILFCRLLKAIPTEKEFFKLHINAINHLFSHVSVEELLVLYERNRPLALNLMTKGHEIKVLLDYNLTLTNLQEIYNTNPRLANDLLEYNRNLVQLIDLGISINSMREIYQRNPEIGKILLEKSSDVKNLIDSGIQTVKLINLAKRNPGLASEMIKYNKNIIDLCDIGNCDFTKTRLIELYEKYPAIAKVLMRYGKELIRLPEMGISMFELADLDVSDSNMSIFLDRNYQKVINLLDKGFEPGELIEICKKKPNVAKIFISYEYNFYKLIGLNILPDEVSDIYDVSPEGAAYLVQYAPNLEKLYKAKFKIQKFNKILMTDANKAKLILQRTEEIIDIIKYTSLKPRDILKCNTQQIEDLLGNKVTPNNLEQSLKTKKPAALADLLDHMEDIGLGRSGASNCGTHRAKRVVGECSDKIEFYYDPLRETSLTPGFYTQLPNGRKSNTKLYSYSILAAIWTLPNEQKSQMIQKAIKLNSNVGDTLKEGEHNWSLREKNIINNYNAYMVNLANMHTPILQEITPDQIPHRNCIIYQNSRSSLVVLKTDQHFKFYSFDLNYHHLFKTNDNIPYSSVKEFVDLFFLWKDQNSEFKTYALSPGLSTNMINEITGILSFIVNFEDDHKLLKASHNSKVEGLLLEDIYDLFSIDEKTIEIEKLHDQFFILNRARLTLKIDKLHEILPRLDVGEKQALFTIIKKYNLIASWNTEKIIDEHVTQMMNLYSAKVINEIKEKGSINLQKLSELSWLTFEVILKQHPNIQPELLVNIIETVKNFHSNLFSNKLFQSGVTQGLFLLPTIIKSVNYDNYAGLIHTGEMIAGDMAINKLIGSIIKYLPPDRAELITKLPIASPIFKAITIYSIVQLHKELNNMAVNAPEREMVKHALIGQYVTIGLIGAELLGVELGPAWFILMGIQLMVEAEDFKKLYKLDVTNYEALIMSLGFKQEILHRILEERSLVEESLLMPPALINNIGWKIVQIPKIETMGEEVIREEAVPEEVRTHLLDLVKEDHTDDHVYTVRAGVYKLTVEYELDSLNLRIRNSPLSLLNKGSIVSKTWEKYAIDVSSSYSTMKFGEFLNDQTLHIDSNNWFLDKFILNNTFWYRVPLLPQTSGFAATNANGHPPVSRDTGSSAIYINKDVIDHHPENLNNIHFSFDAREGSINLDISENGLKRMDQTNNAYLGQATLAPLYNSSKPYLLEVLVTHKNINPSIDYNQGGAASINLSSDSQRLTTFYEIDNNSPSYIKDLSKSTVISFFSKNNTHAAYMEHLVYGVRGNAEADGSQNNLILRDRGFGIVELNSNKKNLQIIFYNNIINNNLILGAQNLEVHNVQGKIENNSTLNIQPQTQSFYTTLIGNIIVIDGTNKLILKGLMSQNETIKFSKVKTLDSVIAYSITANDILSILNSITIKLEFIYSNRSFDQEKYPLKVNHTQADMIKSAKINLEFYHHDTQGSLTVDTLVNNIAYIEGKIYEHNALLVIDSKQTILKIYDNQGFVHKTLITHYASNAIYLNKNDYLVRIFDHVNS